MSDGRNMEFDFDLYLRTGDHRVLDGPLFFILKNLQQGIMGPDYIKYLEQSLYADKLKQIEGIIGEPIDLGSTSFPDGLLDLMDHYERERKGIADMLRYGRPPALTVDGVVLMDGKLLLIRRGNEPFKGMHALPGGFVDYGEPTEKAVVREVREETGLRTRIDRLVGVYSDPARDPRGHTVSAVYILEVTGGELSEGDDASSVELVDPDDLPELAFDHEQVVKDALTAYRNRA